MKKSKLVNGFWCNAVILVSSFVGILITLLACAKSDDYSSIIRGGSVYVIPYVVECVQFVFDEKKRIIFGKKIATYVEKMLIINAIYIILNLAFIVWSPNSEVINTVFLIITAICMLGYPFKAFIFMVFYYRELKSCAERKEKEEE